MTKAPNKKKETSDTLASDADIRNVESKETEKRSDSVKKADPKKKETPNAVAKTSSADPIVLWSFVVFALACLAVVGITIYDVTLADHTPESARYGDKVNVEYTGCYFGFYGSDNAVVFDTNVSDVGNGTSDKSYEFTEKSSYKPLSFTIGEGKYLSAFEKSIIGKTPGQTVRISIPNGYGELEEGENRFSGVSKTNEIDLTQSFPTKDSFEKFFDTDAPKTGIPTVLKSPYGWDAMVIVNTGGDVTVEYMPEDNKTYEIADGVSTKVTSVADKITFDYVFNDFKYNERMIRIVYGGEYVYVIESSGDVMTYKTTDEKVGIDLYFVIKFIDYQ